MSELKRCPFCGGDNVGVWHNRPVSPLIADSYEVRCYNCNFGLRPERLKEKAIEAWNTRKPMQNIMERLEEKSDFHVKLANYEMNVGTIVEMEKHKMAIDVYSKAIEIVKEEGGLNV